MKHQVLSICCGTARCNDVRSIQGLHSALRQCMMGRGKPRYCTCVELRPIRHEFLKICSYGALKICEKLIASFVQPSSTRMHIAGNPISLVESCNVYFLHGIHPLYASHARSLLDLNSVALATCRCLPSEGTLLSRSWVRCLHRSPSFQAHFRYHQPWGHLAG